MAGVSAGHDTRLWSGWNTAVYHHVDYDAFSLMHQYKTSAGAVKSKEGVMFLFGLSDLIQIGVCVLVLMWVAWLIGSRVLVWFNVWIAHRIVRDMIKLRAIMAKRELASSKPKPKFETGGVVCSEKGEQVLPADTSPKAMVEGVSKAINVTIDKNIADADELKTLRQTVTSWNLPPESFLIWQVMKSVERIDVCGVGKPMRLLF